LAKRRGLKRPVIELVVSFILVLVSAALFAWTSLGWWQPTEEPALVAQSSLVLYTNDPHAVITAQVGFGSGGDGELTALIVLNFAVAAENQEKFRWALIGTDSMTFAAEMETNGAKTNLVERNLKQPPVLHRAKSCDDGKPGADDESIIVGGLGSAFLLGTDGVENVDPGVMLTVLHFPRIKATRSLEEYTYSLGAVGMPSGDDAIQMGPLKLQFIRDCVDLGKNEDVGKSGKLHAAPVAWDASFHPADAGDTVITARPDLSYSGGPDWKFTKLIRPQVTFSSKRLHELHQSALFLGGLAGGIGTNFLVQGITGLTRRRAEEDD
jgi:hypothetical protein